MLNATSEHRLHRRRLLAGALALSASAVTGCAAPIPTGSTAPLNPGSPAMPDARRILLAYFSRAGENYFNGGRRFLDVGNTQVLAELIAARVGVTVYRIEAAEPYSDDYDATVARNVREQERNARPAITGALPDVAGYDTVLLGSPIWNVQPPMIMRTFTESLDLAGKRVIPFTTHAMSGLGQAVEVYTSTCRGATLGEGLAVRGEEVGQAAPAVREWLRRVGLAG